MAAEGELFQIGEVAKLYHESVGTLRHYGAGGAAGTGICRPTHRLTKKAAVKRTAAFCCAKAGTAVR